MSRRRLLITLAAALVAACQDPTQVTMSLTTDLPCERLHSVEIFVAGPGESESASQPPTAEALSCEAGRIGSLVVVPSGAPDARFDVRVVAGIEGPAADCQPPDYQSDAGDCVVARRSLTFLERTPLTLPITMREACIDVPCAPGLSCVGGGCVFSEIADATACVAEGCPESVLPACTTPSTCPGDTNGDGSIDVVDLGTVALAFGSVCGDETYNPAADFNADGLVDEFDNALLNGNFNCLCDDLCTKCDREPTCNGDLNNDQAATFADINFFVQAFGSSCGDANYLRFADFDRDGDVDEADQATMADLIANGDC